VIVVDDAGPEDGTRGAVEAFATKYPDHRVEYIRHVTNQGVSVARRTAFEASRGEYIAFLDADDSFLAEKLEEHVKDLQAHSGCVMVHGPTVDEKFPVEPAVADREWFYHGDVSHKYFHRKKRNFLRESRICNSTMTCRRGALSVEDFPTQMAYQTEDKLLWLILSGRGSFFYNRTPLTRYRRHDASYTTAVTRKPSLMLYANLELMLHFLIRQKNPVFIICAGHEILRIVLGIAMWCAEKGGTNQGSTNIKVRFALVFSSLFQRCG
jgi:glycosyltransferase involved in cell wall biosynthesis